MWYRMLRQAQHERKTKIIANESPFVLSPSKDEPEFFQQPARLGYDSFVQIVL